MALRESLLGFVLFGLAATACTSVLGYGDLEVREEGAGGSTAVGGAATGTPAGTGGGTATGTGSAGAGGSAPSCGDGWSCVPASAAGSVALVTEAASCPLGWSEAEELYVGVDPGCTACTCTPSAGQCNGGTITRFSNTTCGTHKDDYQVTDGSCVDVFESADANQARSYLVDINPVLETCLPLGSSPRALDTLRACVPSEDPPGACPAGYECVPSVSGGVAEICVLVEGAEQSCPSTAVEGKPAYRTASDGRTCDCDCVSPAGGSCSGGGVTLYDSIDCDTSGTALVSVAAGSCVNTSSYTVHDSFSLEAGTYVSGLCTPQASPGSVTFSSPVTLCCGG